MQTIVCAFDRPVRDNIASHLLRPNDTDIDREKSEKNPNLNHHHHVCEWPTTRFLSSGIRRRNISPRKRPRKNAISNRLHCLVRLLTKIARHFCLFFCILEWLSRNVQTAHTDKHTEQMTSVSGRCRRWDTERVTRSNTKLNDWIFNLFFATVFLVPLKRGDYLLRDG